MIAFVVQEGKDWSGHLLFLSLGGLDEGRVLRSSTELLRLAEFCGCSPWRFLREPLWGWQMWGATVHLCFAGQLGCPWT